MKLYQRTSTGEADKENMSALAREFAAHQHHVIDLPYRLSSWALDDPENVSLWFDESDILMGWAVLQTPFWAVDMVCHPSVESQLRRTILAWADQRAQAIIHTPYGHPAWYVMVFEEQTQHIRDLEEAGFKCQADVGENSWSQILMEWSTQTLVKLFYPPSGYTVRSLKGEEVEAYVELHRSVFESKNMTAGWRVRTLKTPAYRCDLDIVVESPDERLVAFCVGWFNEKLSAGQIEPLGCHKDFRKYGLGRVALSHGLRRLQSLGAKKIFVETDSFRNTALRLYEFFDFRVIRNILVYRKDYE